MKKVIEYVSSDTALDLCKDQGYPIGYSTLHLWYHKYHLGKKIAGRLQYNKEKLLKILSGDNTNEKN